MINRTLDPLTELQGTKCRVKSLNKGSSVRHNPKGVKNQKNKESDVC